MKVIALAAAIAAATAGAGAASLPARGIVAIGQAGGLFRGDDAALSLVGTLTFPWGRRFAVGAGAGYERFPHEIDYAYPKYHVPAWLRLNVRFFDRPFYPALIVDGGAAFTTSGFFHRGYGEYRYSKAVNPLLNVGAEVAVPVGGRLSFVAEPALRLEWMEGRDYDVFVFAGAYLGLGIDFGAAAACVRGAGLRNR